MSKTLAIVLVMLAWLCAAARAQEPAPTPEAAAEDYFPFKADERQQGLILAGALAKSGRQDMALKLYQALARAWPGDEDVLEQYAQALLDAGEVERARALILKWLAAKPDSPRALGVQARLLLAQEDFEHSFSLFQRLLRTRPDDAATLSDYAFARQSAGDWSGALDLYSQSLDLDPENQDAAQAAQAILLERRPKLDVGFSSYMRQDQTTTYTYSTALSAQAGKKVRMQALYDLITVHSPGDQDTDGVDEAISSERVRAIWEADPRWTVEAGIGSHQGAFTGLSEDLAVSWRVHRPGSLRLCLERNLPWYDEVLATTHGGSMDQASLSYEGFYEDVWGLLLSARRTRYNLKDSSPYGTRDTLNAVLTRRLLSDPDILVSYSYFRAWFKYDNDVFTPIGMVQHEDVHSLSASLTKTVAQDLDLRMSLGVSQDTYKPTENYFGGPGFALRLGPRLEVHADLFYSNDSAAVGGGETMTLTSGFGLVF
ncbi:MAG: tetratricopeptide repeat protein [Desulfovibrionaceae bacterium]|nr:tetratricopeptide repeat protein [Desulfovibrionaceae bacterium]